MKISRTFSLSVKQYVYETEKCIQVQISNELMYIVDMMMLRKLEQKMSSLLSKM